MVAPIVSLVFWRIHPQAPEAVASSCASASCYRSTEDIRVIAVVIFELALRDVERQIFFADLVIATDDATLEDRPEALNRLSVNGTDNVLRGAVHDSFVRVFGKTLIGNVFVGREQANLGRDSFTNETLHIDRRQLSKDAGNDAALALYSADDGALWRGLTLAAQALVLVRPLAADERFINLNNAHQLAKFLVLQGGADAMADVPSGFIRAEAHEPLDLHGADALLCGQHQVNDLEPVAQIKVRVRKDGADEVREAISAALTAIRAFPLKFHRGERVNVCRAAARAMDAIGPAVRHKVEVASLLIRKHLVELGCRQLFGFASHFSLSDYEERLA